MSAQPSFEQTLDDPELRSVFLSFLQKNHQAETLLFVEHVEKYFVLKSDEARYSTAASIMSSFFSHEAENEINLPASLREEIIKKFSACTPNNCPKALFEVVHDLILLQLKSETFLSFLKSTAYLDYVVRHNECLNNKRVYKKTPKFVGDTDVLEHDMVDALAESIWQLSNGDADDIQKCTEIVQMLDEKITTAQEMPEDPTLNVVIMPEIPLSPKIMPSPAIGLTTPKTKPHDFDDDTERVYRKIFSRNGLQTKKHKSMLKTYKHTFLPSELVKYMTTNVLLGMTKERAMAYISLFVARKFIAPLTKGTEFDEKSSAIWKAMKKRRVVIVGGGFAGCIVANSLKDKFEVVVIDKKQQFEYIMDFPSLVVNPSCYSKITHPYEKITNIKHIHGSAHQVNHDHVIVEVPSGKLSTFESIGYDYLVLATGARCQLPFPVDDAGIKRCVFSYSSKSILKSFAGLQEAKKIMVLGAGPTGIEVASELALKYKNTQVVLVSRPNEFLEKECKAAHKYIVKHLNRFKNLKWMLGKEVQSIHDNIVTLKPVHKKEAAGASHQSTPTFSEQHTADLFFICCGTKPRTEYLQQEMAHSLDAQKRVIVNHYLQVAKGVISSNMEYYDNVFAVGDIVNLPEDMLAQIAMLHASAVANNVRMVDKKKPKEKMTYYKPAERIQIVSTGEGKAIMFRGDVVVSEGMVSAKIKQWLRTKVMIGVKQ